LSTWFEPGLYATDTGPSSQVIAELVVSLFHPVSVVDVGCGPGTLLSYFRSAGIADLCGIDGPPVSAVFKDDAGEFVAADLTRPLHLPQRFEIATCLEVAEHLPPTAAETLVETLVGLAPVVVFSAATPGQGGEGHINEQWPTYWQQIFRRSGLVCLDVLRGQLASKPDVLNYYRTNTFVYMTESVADRFMSQVDPEYLADPYTISMTGGVRRDLHSVPWGDLCMALVMKLDRRLKRD